MVEREYIQSNLRTWKVKLLLLLYLFIFYYYIRLTIGQLEISFFSIRSQNRLNYEKKNEINFQKFRKFTKIKSIYKYANLQKNFNGTLNLSSFMGGRIE